MGTYVHTEHDDFDDVVGQGLIPIVHDQNIVLSEARLSIDAGITKRFGSMLMVPVRLVSTTIDYRDNRRNIVQLASPSTHHRNETLAGIGDPMLLGGFTASYVTLRAGLTVPLGRTEEDPFALGDMGLSHQHIQMGTGTVNPVVSAEVSVPWQAWRFGGYALTQQILYENSKGYQGGDRYAVGIGARRGLGEWALRAGFDMQAESSERWNGVVYTEEGNQGRIDVMVSMGASYAATDRLSIDTTLKIPFINHVVGGQLRMPALLEVGVGWRFGATAAPKKAEDDHEHGEHDHGEHKEHGEHDDHDKHAAVDTSGADFVDLGPPGAAVDLVPVKGKITIFEFGAEWCEPCKTLEPVLLELAKKHSDVAVRRIDVVDWDSAVVAKYLTPRGFDLPHVKVFDATGTLVYEQSSAPGKLAKMIEDIRAIAEPPPVSAPPAPTSESKPTPKPPAVKPYRVELVVTDKGYEPGEIKVPRNRPVQLVFTRKTEKTCATEVVLEGKVTDLPLNQTVTITRTFTKPGTITYACAMNMIKGTIVVQ